MRKITRVITDCDECLVDYRGGFLAVHPELAETYIFPAELNAAFRQSDAIRNLAPVPGSMDFVKAINDALIPIDIVTSLGNEPIAFENRMHNLDNLFGRRAFDKIHVLPYRASKRQVLTELGYDPQTTVFIDDHLGHLMESPYINVWLHCPNFDPTKPTPEMLSHVAKEVSSMREAAEFVLNYGRDDKRVES